MNVRSKNLKIRNLPKGRKRIDCINAKPFVLFGICLITGILLLILCNSYLIGTVLVLISLYNFLFIKNEILVEFYEEYAVFYRTTSYKDECFLLFWNDVRDWYIQRAKSNYDEIHISLKNDQKVVLKCVSKHKIQRYFRRFVCTGHKKEILPSQTS